MGIDGEVAPGFEPIRDAFAANFEQHGDVGAAFCVYRQGAKVVDLWGGVADTGAGRDWEEDTLQLVFSTTKGATAICALRLVERGDLDLNAPVADYWPEFKAEGKERVPVRWLLSHRGGLPVIDARLTPSEALAWRPVVSADEVAEPLGLDFWIGLPSEQQHRVSKLIQLEPPGPPEAFDVEAVPESVRAIVAAFLDSAFSPMLGDNSFGHAGAGGSLGFADPESQVAFGYVMNRMQQNLAGDPRTLGLVDAVRRCLT